MAETWRPIPSLGGRYEASDLGRIRNAAGYVMATFPHAQGYRLVGVSTEGTRASRRHRRVHRLVLEAFVGPCPEGHEARHLDGDPANNRLDNLAWGTSAENAQDCIRHGTFARGSRSAAAKLREEDIPAVLAAVCEVPLREVGRRFGVSDAVVGGIVRREIWAHVPVDPELLDRAQSATAARWAGRGRGPEQPRAALKRACAARRELTERRRAELAQNMLRSVSALAPARVEDVAAVLGTTPNHARTYLEAAVQNGELVREKHFTGRPGRPAYLYSIPEGR